MRIDARLYFYFVAVAEELSFTRAAQRLYIAQPWLSAQIRKLEAILGFDLFLRNSRHVELTRQGHALLPDAIKLAQANQVLESTIQHIRHGQQKRLRIGIPPYGSHFERYQQLVDSFISEHPTISLEVEYGWSPLLLNLLRQGSIDLAFTVGTLNDAQFEQQPVACAQMFLLMQRQDPLAKLTQVPLQALAERRIAVFPQALNPQLYEELYAPLDEIGAQLIAIPQWDSHSLKRHIANGMLWIGFGDTHSSVIADRGRNITLRTLNNGTHTIPFSLVRSAKNVSEAAVRFWNLAK